MNLFLVVKYIFDNTFKYTSKVNKHLLHFIKNHYNYDVFILSPITPMACWRKTSKPVAKLASKILKSPSSTASVKKVAGSALSQRAPQAKKK